MFGILIIDYKKEYGDKMISFVVCGFKYIVIR